MTVFLPDTSTLIDAFRGKRNRKKHLLALLAQGHSLAIWKDEDHPELKDGAYAWVRCRMRRG